MEVRSTKSCFIISKDVIDAQVHELFPFPVKHIDDGFTYLGFTLKPNCYDKMDWWWLLDRVEMRIGRWCYRWLSLGGEINSCEIGT